ncbi:hypothetical protein BN1263170273 [Stenotrophomonas indicatrix]|nr:hypothetical protein BN1263170273 [Stenotrophomonas indicatrix]
MQLHSELFINATVLLLVEAAVLDLMRPTKKPDPNRREIWLFVPRRAVQMVEVGGIEPPSEGTPSPALHA